MLGIELFAGMRLLPVLAVQRPRAHSTGQRQQVGLAGDARAHTLDCT